MELKQQRILWGSLLIGSLIISLISWVVFVPRFKPVILYFPAADNVSIESEVHYIPWSKLESEQIRHTIQALAIGPLSMKYRRIIPSATSVRAVYVKGKQLWIDFDSTVQAPDSECPLNPKDRISSIIRSVRFNYPTLNSIKVLVNGQELGVIPYRQERKS